MKIHLAAFALLSLAALPQQDPGQWTSDTLSEPRANLAATSSGTLVAFAGGLSATGKSNVVDFYDVSTGAWTTSALSVAREGLAATSAGGLMFFAGGWTGTASPQVDIYDPQANSWTVAGLSRSRTELTATSVGGKAFFAGGAAALFAPDDRVDIYDTASGTWTSAQLSRGRRALASTTVNDLALFAGGIFSGTASPRVDLYDSSANVWFTHNLSLARSQLAATSVAGRALFAGGILGNTPRSVVDIYDQSSNSWSTASLSQARWGLAAATIDHYALFAGGAQDSAGAVPSDVVDIYDSSTGIWSTSSLSVPRHSFAAASPPNAVLFGGGFDPSGLSDVVDVLNNDCNGNGIPDESDIASGFSQDCNGNGLPDECDIAMGSVPDCNGNGVPDGCDLSAGTSQDCNVNWIPDECDIAAGTSEDRNGNGIPDGCEVIGTVYCSPNAGNSTGFPAMISALGDLDPAANNLFLTASSLPPFQFGYFLASQTQAVIPFPGGSQGVLCLGDPIARFNVQIQNSGAGGEFSIPVDLTAIPLIPSTAVQLGDTWNFQCWYRDAGATSNFSDGLSITFAPVPAPSVEFLLPSQALVEQTTQILVRIDLSHATTQPVSIPYTEGGTATAHVDYRVESTHPFVILAGETGGDMQVTIADDFLDEPDETVIITLQQPTNGVLGSQVTYTLTILDND